MLWYCCYERVVATNHNAKFTLQHYLSVRTVDLPSNSRRPKSISDQRTILVYATVRVSKSITVEGRRTLIIYFEDRARMTRNSNVQSYSSSRFWRFIFTLLSFGLACLYACLLIRADHTSSLVRFQPVCFDVLPSIGLLLIQRLGAHQTSKWLLTFSPSIRRGPLLWWVCDARLCACLHLFFQYLILCFFFSKKNGSRHGSKIHLFL